ncbi:aminotransferase class I/II-fold pyridoxal phosphate-dependent enzyme [Carboxydothermus pertinax]|uniref:homocysteine desulfhydrase n=1 Tax=Carboxydothermus pertinax TaxID=870242 RepID=A0A1L8CTG0_9THEO|nr:aminotransferase class I/II-fold pyridoxal phosphate-dependent enzyme [Carboxydothermus pertinax]GAV22119.1 O-acetylhomoserine/O-acetylserine sulfhydrylase [Carboxydothermus pertinax]
MRVETFLVSRAVEGPSLQTAYFYKEPEKLEQIFGGKSPGFFYSRVANPTVAVLEEKVARLEGGAMATATSSGMAAIALTFMAFAQPGAEFLVCAGLFGGTLNLLKNLAKTCGITYKLLPSPDPELIEKHLTPNTRLVFVESIGNPTLKVPDFSELSSLLKEKKIPLVVDNTVAPLLVKPLSLGANIVIHSLSKYISGQGTVIGGCIVDGGNFEWDERFQNLFPLKREAGPLAFSAYIKKELASDMGMCLSPFAAWQVLIGSETLALRMERMVQNARELSEFLQSFQEIKVNYPGLGESPEQQNCVKYLASKGGNLIVLSFKDKETAFNFIKNLNIARLATNIGDVRTLVCHLDSTIYQKTPLNERQILNITDSQVRVSVGIENIEDLKEDFAEALQKLLS